MFFQLQVIIINTCQNKIMEISQTQIPQTKIRRILGKSRHRRSIFSPIYYQIYEQLQSKYEGHIYKCGDYGIKIIDVSECSREQATNLLDKTNDNWYFIHQNIVRHCETFVEGKQIIKVMEWCQTDLKRYLQSKPEGKLSQSQAIRIFKQIVNGCSYLREEGKYHHNLKPQNVLLKQSNLFKNKNIIRLTDFDSAWKDKNNKLKNYENNIAFINTQDSSQKFIYSQFLNTYKRTMAYSSPECLEFLKQSQKNQIWSLGIILYQMIFGERPWKGNDKEQVLNNIKNIQLSFPIQGSLQIKILLIQMLNLSPGQRIQWKKLINVLRDLCCEKKYYKRIKKGNQWHQTTLKQISNPCNRQKQSLYKKISQNSFKSFKLVCIQSQNEQKANKKSVFFNFR